MYKAHGNLDQPDESGFRRNIGPTITMFSHNNVGTATALKGKDENAEQTLLHEIGHHDSSIAGNESSAYDTPRHQAAEEAHADRFAVTHFRRDPRNKGEYDPRQHTYMGRGQQDFGEGSWRTYENALPASMHPPAKRNLSGQQFDQPELDEHDESKMGDEVFYGPGVQKRQELPWIASHRGY
jgi:hypothetical protein